VVVHSSIIVEYLGANVEAVEGAVNEATRPGRLVRSIGFAPDLRSGHQGPTSFWRTCRPGQVRSASSSVDLTSRSG
jgi:hypothetical protein